MDSDVIKNLTYSIPTGLGHFDSVRKIPKRKTYFNPIWELKLDGVRRSIRGETHFFCLYCQKDYNISSMGITAITAHQSTPRHRKNVESRRLNSKEVITLDTFDLDRDIKQILNSTESQAVLDAEQLNNKEDLIEQNPLTLKTTEKIKPLELIIQSLGNNSNEIDIKQSIPLIEQFLVQKDVSNNEQIECQESLIEETIKSPNKLTNEKTVDHEVIKRLTENRERKRKRAKTSDGDESSDDDELNKNFNERFLDLKAAKMRYYTSQANLAETKCILINEQIALIKAQCEESKARTALLRLQFQQQIK
ncbi:hypothetical protein Mgra_00003546 [Meloidogyne graminicola]|uniref:Uncharacterized protein n=1 Tax=Meloidogyne graminicola TaxID=189291 RepID=A0A8S9ZUL9_9BILA|nr:hypothetical protein Mgra_00003546 [Meloidogyne graminicola]